MKRIFSLATVWFPIVTSLYFIASQPAQAQLSTVVFSDDFSANTIDPAKYQADAPFFEGGVGDIHATNHDGVIEFVGTTSQQWWSGGTLRVVPTFTASEEANAVVSIDRVAEAGVGTASRSALWILDETKTKYVLFADDRAETGWEYNRKIGEDGDVPTGGGTDIPAFNGANFDDGGLHHMKMVADGKTVKLYLDGQLGVEVKFPFSKVIFEFGSYARANNDTADTTWDNLKIETALQTIVAFSDDFAGNTIDPAKYQPDAPFFEGGTGDVHATAHDGVIEFVGTTSQQWWSGGTLRLVPTFDASEETPVSVTIDRVAEAGVGTASRSALWILDETRTKYVLFADNRAETGWEYNRKIGEDGDVPTGSGTDIVAFNGATFDDGGLHHMKMVADGKTVKLYLDDQLGAEVKFPFSKVVLEFGSYARANNDTADTTWDNIKVETVARQTSVAVVLSDDFASNTIDPAKYQPDAPFFEGGTGDIHATAHDGVIEFVGTTSVQWWSGGTLRIVPTFAPSDEATITLSIDRVAEAGVGTASRSALWILDETKTKYVLFADNRGEDGWEYNRKIGEDGDVPTGGGTDIAAFNGANFDDGGLHHMGMVADGKTVKLLLDGQQGAEVKFPFSPVVFEFGSYARANNDTADTTWDNLRIETAGSASFSPAALSVRPGRTSADVTLRIPAGLNAQAAVQVQVVSSDASIAVPDGGTGGTITLMFPAGGANTATFKVRGVALGGAQFTVQSGVAAGNQLTVAVISDPGVVLQEDFAAAAIDTSKWQTSTRPFETGTGTFTVAPATGALEISGSVDTATWPGASLITAKAYTATKELNLVVDVDRVSIDPGASTAARTGMYLTTADHTKYVFFSQNVPSGWTVNLNPGSATGGGQAVAEFNTDLNDNNAHHIKLVADGETVEIFLDGRSGGRREFPVNSGIFVELAAYASAEGDTVTGRFDNVKIENALPCVAASPASVSMTAADTSKQVTVTVPTLLHDAAPVSVTITSQNPGVAIPAGAVNGVLTLTFAVGAADSQTVTISPVGLGATTFTIASNPQACVSAPLKVEVVAVPQVLLTDDFSAATIDPKKWRTDDLPFESGGTAVTDTSGISLTNGTVKISVTAEGAPWPGLALATVDTYSPGATAPVTFEIDRVLHDFVLVTGTGANQRTGVWITDATRANYVFFSENEAHDGRNYGWQYNRQIGQADDNGTGLGINIAAFDAAKFNDAGNHRIKVIANGSTVKLYLDDVFGAEVAFPFTQGIVFEFGAYVSAATDIVYGYFDNAHITGGSAPVGGKLTAVLQGANVVISWTGPGSLQEAAEVIGPWTAVPNATSPYTASATSQRKFYRLQN